MINRDEALQLLKSKMFFDNETGDWHGLSPSGLLDIFTVFGLIEPNKALDAAAKFTARMEEAGLDFDERAKVWGCINSSGVKVVEG